MTSVVTRSAEAKKNSKVLPILKEIIATKIKLDDTQKPNVQIIETFVKKHMINEMKAVDPMFSILYQEIYHTGSFYDGLRVGEATEFDLNIILKMPFAESFLDLLHDADTHPGFAKLRTKTALRFMVNQDHPMDPHLRSLENNLCEVDKNDKDRLYFNPDKLRRWIEGVTSNAVKKFIGSPEELKKNFGITKIGRKKSGPAMTLLVEDGDVCVDIDLVPVLGLKLDILGPGDTAFYKNNKEVANVLKSGVFKDKSVKQFFLVPKPAPSNYQNKTIKDPRLQWRLDFHDHEKILLQDKYLGANQCSKNLIKLLKLFRDKNEPLKPVCSYVLKTTVMLMTKDRQRKWSETNLPTLFIEALSQFHIYLSKKPCFVPFYFDSKCNILWKLKQSTADSIEKWLKKIILRLENSSNNIPSLQLPPSTPDTNYVGLLNDLLKDNTPSYEVTPPQNRIRARVSVGGRTSDWATASSKQEAKEKAAKAFMDKFNVEASGAVNAGGEKAVKNAVVLLKERCDIEKEKVTYECRESTDKMHICKVTAFGEHAEAQAGSKKEAKTKASENVLVLIDRKRKSIAASATKPAKINEACKSFVSILQERSVPSIPAYEDTHISDHKYKCVVKHGDYRIAVEGTDKKDAKQKAAKSLFEKVQQTPKMENSSANETVEEVWEALFGKGKREE